MPLSTVTRTLWSSLPTLVSSETTKTEVTSQSLIIPCGILLLFFGTFILKQCILLLSTIYLSSLLSTSYPLTIPMMFTLIVSTIAMYYILEKGPKYVTGGLLGGLLVSTWYMSNLLIFIIIVFSFSYIYHVLPNEVSVFITSYGGAFLMFYGMDNANHPNNNLIFFESIPQSLGSIDLWFSVFSFLMVGVLGCGVQIMLLMSLQQERIFSRGQHVPIP